jgi:hypothetical protein
LFVVVVVETTALHIYMIQKVKNETQKTHQLTIQQTRRGKKKLKRRKKERNRKNLL